MPNPQSKITAQGQISVPSEVRKTLGVGPGSVLEWVPENGRYVVQRVAKYSWADVHKALFPDGPADEPIDTKQAIRKYLRRKHARR